MLNTEALFLALAASIDNIGIGIALAMKGIRVTPAANLSIAVLTMAGTLLPMLAGWYVNNFENFQQLGRVGALFLVLLGVWLVGKYFFSRRGSGKIRENPVRSRSLTGKRNLSWLEAICLGLILSLNNMPAGLAAGFAGINPLVVALVTMGASFVLLWAGAFLNQRALTARYRAVMDLLSGILILCLGLLSFWEW